MQQHPVPQNVTTFQFRLIGDMTIKQFGYLASGAILAFISFKLPLPALITWPLGGLFGFLGVGFAFIPIEERPMDVWVLSFFKSVYTPTQFVWQRGSASPEPTATSLPSLRLGKTNSQSSSGASTAKPAPSMPNIGEVLQKILANPAKSNPVKIPAASISQSYPLPNLKTYPPSPLPLKIPPQTERAQMLTLEERLKSLETELQSKSQLELQMSKMQQQLTDVLAEKKQIELELAKLRVQASSLQPSPSSAPTTPPKPKPLPPLHGVPLDASSDQTVKVISPANSARAGLPRLTTFPNIITGIVKDDQGNLLPGIIVTVRDKDGVPVRALKTNKLGQFAASTQLGNGTYLVEVEDPRGRFSFDRAQITLNSTVVPTLEIKAKSQKQINRTKLAEEIFGKPKI